MEKYQPLKCPNAQEWLELDEYERVFLVREFHEGSDEPLPDDAMGLHASIHVVVENQIAMEHVPVPATVDRLIHQGLDRHEAIHAVGAIVSSNIYDLTKGNQMSWDQNQYRRRLDKLTARRWRKGKW